MTDFKPGDHVKVINDKYTTSHNGYTGVITAISNDNLWPISVAFDDNDEGNTGDIFAACELELIPADPEPAYVDHELRERMLDKAINSTGFVETTESVLARARAFEAYILGDTK